MKKIGIYFFGPAFHSNFKSAKSWSRLEMKNGGDLTAFISFIPRKHEKPISFRSGQSAYFGCSLGLAMTNAGC
jgi:hypothetical protein